MPTTGAGRLDRRIKIQRATEAPDAEGQNILTFADWITRWAHRRDLRSSERLPSQQPVAMAELVYEVRHDTDTKTITADETYRVVDGARVYDIVGAEPSPQRNAYVYLRVRGRAEVAA